jgi:hypothetical protein
MLITAMSQTSGDISCGDTIICQASCGRPRSGMIETAAAAMAVPETMTASRFSSSRRWLPMSSAPATTIKPPAEMPTRNMNTTM